MTHANFFVLHRHVHSFSFWIFKCGLLKIFSTSKLFSKTWRIKLRMKFSSVVSLYECLNFNRTGVKMSKVLESNVILGLFLHTFHIFLFEWKYFRERVNTKKWFWRSEIVSHTWELKPIGLLRIFLFCFAFFSVELFCHVTKRLSGWSWLAKNKMRKPSSYKARIKSKKGDVAGC